MGDLTCYFLNLQQESILKEFMFSSKLIYLIFSVSLITGFFGWCLGYDMGLAKATKPTETASDILTINTKTLYMTVDGEKNFVIETEEVKKDD